MKKFRQGNDVVLEPGIVATDGYLLAMAPVMGRRSRTSVLIIHMPMAEFPPEIAEGISFDLAGADP